MIKTLMFDVGGVLLMTDWKELYRRFAEHVGVSPDRVQTYYDQQLVELWTRPDGFRSFLADLSITGDEGALRRFWSEEGARASSVNEELLAAIDSMHSRYTTSILSNASESRMMLDGCFSPASHFDRVFYSFERGLVKPDIAYYQLALREMGVEPEEAVFIDDVESYVEGARAAGLHALQFRDNATLFDDLRRLGVQW